MLVGLCVYTHKCDDNADAVFSVTMVTWVSVLLSMSYREFFSVLAEHERTTETISRAGLANATKAAAASFVGCLSGGVLVIWPWMNGVFPQLSNRSRLVLPTFISTSVGLLTMGFVQTTHIGTFSLPTKIFIIVRPLVALGMIISIIVTISDVIGLHA